MRPRMMISFNLMLNSEVVMRRGGSVVSGTSWVVGGEGEEVQQVHDVELGREVGDGGNISWHSYNLLTNFADIYYSWIFQSYTSAN